MSDSVTEKGAAPARDSEEVRWKELLGHAPEFLGVATAEGRLRFINRTFSGYRPEDVIGASIYDFTTPEKLPDLVQVVEEALAGGGPVVAELPSIGLDGRERWYRAHYARLEGDDEPELVIAATDITAFRQAGAALEQAHGELERRAAQISETVGELNREIRRRETVERDLRRSRMRHRNLSRKLLSIQEEERRRIAREVHDELGQALTAVRLELHRVLSALESAPGQAAQSVERAFDLIDATIRDVRRIASDLRPGLLDDLGLVAAIDWQRQQFEERSGIECRFSCDREEIDIEPAHSVALFRVLQESLTNVVRHADASRVDVSLSCDEERVRMVIADDGKGLTRRQLRDPRSLGLIGIRERVRSYGGWVLFRGSARGTSVEVSIPRNVTTSPPPESPDDPWEGPVSDAGAC